MKDFNMTTTSSATTDSKVLGNSLFASSASVAIHGWNEKLLSYTLKAQRGGPSVGNRNLQAGVSSMTV